MVYLLSGDLAVNGQFIISFAKYLNDQIFAFSILSPYRHTDGNETYFKQIPVSEMCHMHALSLTA